ncbi:AMP-dependent synthetase and ligase [Glaciecola punicea ACAM 611]|jgi:long-subunit acyl-CoA synthetase (AMP-forming)|uniref:AMP-dependent synthetase and ligase n=1 Tax=Glaciecola punicea ACAM 611 TaxID=1121923 RepID=H5T940_9ALTE|nr:AMP-binding protein [Glaciecola punicea]GAB54817.1 AMP-dependent synthetase and ligase [Glaciecola punicea ACAM 611]
MSLDNNAAVTTQVVSPLAMLYKRESETPNDHYMTQPSAEGPRTFTWAQTMEQARRLAARINTYRYPKGTRIAILGKNTAEWIVTDIAIMLSGNVSVPIFATAGKDTISYVLEHAECPMMFVGKLDNYKAAHEATFDELVTVSFPYPGIETKVAWDEFTDIEPLDKSPIPDLNDIMTIIYTSGSTGQPKGVVHTYQTICWAAQNSLHAMSVTNQDRAMSYLPLAHITERVLVELASIYSGMTLHFVESLDTFTRDVKSCQPTLFISVPRLWTKFKMGVLAKIPQKKLKFLLSIPLIGKKVAKKIREELGLGSARLWASGSAPLAPSTIEWFHKIGIDISEGWGMTENCAYGTSSVPFRVDKIGAIGSAYEGVTIRIAQDGEIQVKSPCNMVGYYKDQEKTSGVFTNDEYLRTGDKGRMDEEGFIYITGRLKDIFKTEKGKYVAPAPIESKIMETSIVEQVCVTGTSLAQPIALLVLSEEARKHSKEAVVQTLTAMLTSINETLESHARLDRIVIFKEEWSIENDLLTPTLKVKRHIIEEKFKSVIVGEHSDKIVWVD